MAVPNAAVSELVVTTLRNRSPKIASAIVKKNPLLTILDKKGNRDNVTGGRTSFKPLEYAENSTFMFYTDRDILNIGPSPFLTAAEYDWKQAAIAIEWSGREKFQNRGKAEVINWLKAKQRNAERTATNAMARSIYSDGTGYSGKEIGGLRLLVADNPTTGTVGGIDRSAAGNVFWRNFSVSMAAVTSTTITSKLNELYYTMTADFNDEPDLLIVSTDIYRAYEASLVAQQRFTSASVGESGFDTLMFKGMKMIRDGNCPAGHAYMLNTDYLFWEVQTGVDWDPLETIQSINQDAWARLAVWAGALTMSNANRQGVLHI